MQMNDYRNYTAVILDAVNVKHDICEDVFFTQELSKQPTIGKTL